MYVGEAKKVLWYNNIYHLVNSMSNSIIFSV